MGFVSSAIKCNKNASKSDSMVKLIFQYVEDRNYGFFCNNVTNIGIPFMTHILSAKHWPFINSNFPRYIG